MEYNRREMEANPQKLYCPWCRPWREIDTFSYSCRIHGCVNPMSRRQLTPRERDLPVKMEP